MESNETFKVLVWRKYKEETRKIFGTSLAFLFAVVYAITVGIARGIVFGRGSGMNYFQEWIVDFVLTGVLFFIVLSIVNIIRAPYLVGNEQVKKIAQFSSEKLDIIPYCSAEHIFVDADGERHEAIFLGVKNESEVYKIDELRAEIESIAQIVIRPSKTDLSTRRILRMPYIGGKQRTSWGIIPVSLIPEQSMSFCLAYFGAKSPPQVLFGADGYTELSFDDEAIYEVQILFQGHLLEQKEYKKFRYIDMIYSHPAMGFMSTLSMGRDVVRDKSTPDLFRDILTKFYKDCWPNYGTAYLRQQVELPNTDRDEEFKRK